MLGTSSGGDVREGFDLELARCVVEAFGVVYRRQLDASEAAFNEAFSAFGPCLDRC